MSEPVLATATRTTALAEFLLGADSGSGQKLTSYLGSLTPEHFTSRNLDAPDAETRALLFRAAVHDLGWLQRIALRGEDRSRWLSGMVTNTVETLADKTGAYNLVLNAQGRIQGDVYVWRDGESLEMETTAEQAETLFNHLDHFIIMDDVEMAPVTGESALGLTGPLSGEVLGRLGLTELSQALTSSAGIVDGIAVRLFRGHGTLVPHYELWVADEHVPALWQAVVSAGAAPVGSAAVETLRIVEGIPAYGIDIQSRDLAQETSQDRALSFTKGCYLGQEIVERIRSRGQVHRHLRALELTPIEPGVSPAVGTEFRIQSDDVKAAGTLSSVAAVQLAGELRIFGIAMVRAEAEVGNRPLVYSGGTASGGTARILFAPPNLN
jgi:folate-binding protein YgfZ